MTHAERRHSARFLSPCHSRAPPVGKAGSTAVKRRQGETLAELRKRAEGQVRTSTASLHQAQIAGGQAEGQNYASRWAPAALPFRRRVTGAVQERSRSHRTPGSPEAAGTGHRTRGSFHRRSGIICPRAEGAERRSVPNEWPASLSFNPDDPREHRQEPHETPGRGNPQR